MTKFKYLFMLLLLVVTCTPVHAESKGPVNETVYVTENPVIASAHTELVYILENKSNKEIPFELTVNHQGRWWGSFYPYYLENMNQTWVECTYYTCSQTYAGTIPGKGTSELHVDYGSRYTGVYENALSTALKIKEKDFSTYSFDITVTQ